MSKHTPGPWKIGCFQGGGRVPIESETLQVCVIETDSDEMAHDVERADARLIAAAPELLGALRECVRVLAEHHAEHEERIGRRTKQPYDAPGTVGAAAWAAIRKAEGEK